MPLTRKQLEGLRHCPDKRVQQVVETALALLDQLKEADERGVAAQVKAASYARKCRDSLHRRTKEQAEQVRVLQERLALKELDYRILVTLTRDGVVTLYSEQNIPVKFVYLPDLGRGGEDEAEEWATRSLPLPYKTLYDSPERKRIGMGTAKSCLSRGELNDVKAKLAAVEALRELERTGGES